MLLLKGTHPFIFSLGLVLKNSANKEDELIPLCFGLSLPLACWPFPSPHHGLNSSSSQILLLTFKPSVLLAEWYCQLFVFTVSLPVWCVCVCTYVWKMTKKKKNGRRERREECLVLLFLTVPQQLYHWMTGLSQDLVWPVLKFLKQVVLLLGSEH